MADSPRTPEEFRAREPRSDDFHVNELAADQAGALSPFGPDRVFPFPIDKITYTHPGPENRPNLAGDR